MGRKDETIDFFEPYIEGFKNGFKEYLDYIFNEEKVKTESGYLCYLEDNLKIFKLIPKDKIVVDVGCSFGLQHILYKNHKKYIGIQKFREGLNCDIGFKPIFRVFTDNAKIIEKEFKNILPEEIGWSKENKDNFFGVANHSLWHDCAVNKEDIELFKRLFPCNNYAVDEGGVKIIY